MVKNIYTILRNIISIQCLLFLSLTAYSSNVILKKGIPLHSQILMPNTTYEICDTFDLAGSLLILPEDVTLFFKGGTISGGKIVFNNTKLYHPSFNQMHFSGSTPEDYFDIRDYGAQSGIKTIDNSILINELISLSAYGNRERSAKTIHIPNGTYYIKKPIYLWAGWESPITLEGNGNTSTLCQLSDNEYILALYECHYVKNLRLTYDKRQELSNTRSVAIACQRAIFSLFENLTICRAHTAFGYLKLSVQKNEFNPTGYKDQCYVSCNFRNIRIYESSGYAFDFKKELSQGDSGSAYDNIYINSNDWLSNTKDNISNGVIRGDNTVACFTQLNIEGDNYSGTLIDLDGMSRITVESFHLEGIKKTPTIVRVRVQSVISFNSIDIQRCIFNSSNFNSFIIKDSGLINVKLLTIRQDCKNISKDKQLSLTNNIKRLKLEQKLDAIKIFQ